MTNASALTHWVPRPLVAVARLHTLVGPPASPDPDPLVGIVDDGLVHPTHRVIRRTGPVPALVDWWTLGLAVLSMLLLPASGFRLALGVGILALVAARRDDRATVALPTP